MLDKITWSNYKRLLELCYADPAYLHQFMADPDRMLKASNLLLDPKIAKEALLVQTQPDYAKTYEGKNLYMEGFRQMVNSVQAHVDLKVTPDKIAHSSFREWTHRQKKRMAFESRYVREQLRTYTVPVSFTLSDGCSIGCPFCCLSAPKLKEVFCYTPENARLWRSVLTETRSLIGEIAGAGMCYLASEPFDNPDYEKFISDFYKITRYYPQTTTAAAMRDVKRTRRLMKALGDEHLKNAALRFSVLTLNHLQKIHAEFSAEELYAIELLPNNPESLYHYSLSGRALNLTKSLPPEKFMGSVTCVCVIGFSVNMPKKTISLIAPRRPDDEYPLGMQTYDTISFADAASYRNALTELIQKWMAQEVPIGLPLRANPYITLTRENNYLEFHGDGAKRLLSGSNDFCDAVELLFAQDMSIEQLLSQLHISGYSRAALIEKLQFIYDLGYVDIKTI